MCANRILHTLHIFQVHTYFINVKKNENTIDKAKDLWYN